MPQSADMLHFINVLNCLDRWSSCG